MWGAAWLRRATGEGAYKDYIQYNGKTLGAEDNINEFGWDNKHAGLNVLVSKVSRLSLSFYFYFFLSFTYIRTKMHFNLQINFFNDLINEYPR